MSGWIDIERTRPFRPLNASLLTWPSTHWTVLGGRKKSRPKFSTQQYNNERNDRILTWGMVRQYTTMATRQTYPWYSSIREGTSELHEVVQPYHQNGEQQIHPIMWGHQWHYWLTGHWLELHRWHFRSSCRHAVNQHVEGTNRGRGGWLLKVQVKVENSDFPTTDVGWGKLPILGTLCLPDKFNI